MSFLLETIAALTTAHTIRLVPDPVEPFGYGRDLECFTDLTEDMREIDQNSPRAIIHSCFRFLTTGRDTIPDAPGRGVDLVAMLNAGVTRDRLLELEADIVGEIDLDDRVLRSTATVTLSNTTEPELFVEFKIWPANTGEAFAFTFRVQGSGAVFVEGLK